ncbi:sigma 54-interacting transcriptional regulator [uncultured Thiothrix sp.]|uniref:sigma-54 interaction domain-containing protein n=1 Tax=uncultured Thiothrix sp. TaxID=223185 RepID=UPI0026227CFC|nr:sigma 54-interacting transcriptional regulator [uncultured Thiothrix sp.]
MLKSGQGLPVIAALEGARSDVSYLLQTASQSLLKQFAELCEGAVVVDRQARVVWMNDQYPKRLGITNVKAVIGQPVEAVLPNSLMREVVETGRPIMLDIMSFGAESFVVSRLPLHDEQGRVIGGIGLILLDDARNLAPLVSRYNQIQQELQDTRQQLALARRAKYTLSSLIGTSERLTKLKAQARRTACSNATVLIQGETGTGKELLAQAIHNASTRADKPFVAVNIAAIPEALLEAEFFGAVAGAYTGADRKGRQGKFKLAEGGTLFLDEIGDMPATLQAKLLRVLQEGEYEALGSDQLLRADVRILSATSRDLAQEVAQGKFRADLYYRLNVVPLNMPCLRERLEDLPLLCEQLLDNLSHKQAGSPRELSPGALDYLSHYQWPGNVRELQNVLERAVMLSDSFVISLEDIQALLPVVQTQTSVSKYPNQSEPLELTANTLAVTLAQAEYQAIQDALQICGGNKAKAATRLGISRTSLYEKMATYRSN